MAGSTCEAECIAALEAANERVWIKEFISNLGVIPSASGPMKIFCDNTHMTKSTSFRSNAFGKE